MGYTLPPGDWYQAFTSYAACPGPIYAMPGAPGMINFGTTTIAGVTDGTSNSMMFAETSISWWSNVTAIRMSNHRWVLEDSAVDAEYAPQGVQI